MIAPFPARTPELPIEQHCFASPLGDITVAATPQGLRGVWLAGQRHWPDNGRWRHTPGHALLREAQAQLLQFLQGTRRHFDLPLDASAGTPFQQAVWRALQSIPYGQTTGYGVLAQELGRPQAARAVGAAVGRNPWSIVVPCHRVVGSAGALTGYAGGLERKAALLQLEGAQALRQRA